MADEDRPLKAAGDGGADAWLAQIMAAGTYIIYYTCMYNYNHINIILYMYMLYLCYR